MNTGGKIMDLRIQLQRAQDGLEYVRGILAAGGLELWEAKEYAALEIARLEDIKRLTDEIAAHPSVFA
jgi:hypothetical protein